MQNLNAVYFTTQSRDHHWTKDEELRTILSQMTCLKSIEILFSICSLVCFFHLLFRNSYQNSPCSSHHSSSCYIPRQPLFSWLCALIKIVFVGKKQIFIFFFKKIYPGSDTLLTVIHILFFLQSECSVYTEKETVPIFQRFLILTVLDKTGHVKIPEINVTYILPICLLPTDFVNVTFFGYSFCQSIFGRNS